MIRLFSGINKQVLAEAAREWMRIHGVVGVGEGREKGAPCILVFVRMHTRDIRARIPSRFKGYPVKIEVVGEVHAPPLRRRSRGQS